MRLALVLLVVVVAGATFAAAVAPIASLASRAVQRTAEVIGPGPSIEKLVFPRIPERSTIYAKDGTVLAKLYLDENREVVALDRIPDVTKRAVLAIEDADFYEHRGFDPGAAVRAAISNLVAGEITQGGSTITQQVARNVFDEIGTRRTFQRKVREARVAMRLERVYSKDEILEIYLNEIYLGHGVYGIGTAAEFYFGKRVEKLTVAESALLAGMIASPERLSPIRNRRAALDRRAVVLDRMAELGWLPAARVSKAKEARVALSPRKRKILRQARAPFFVEFIKQRILDDPALGDTRRARTRLLFQGGLEIHTTLDPALQREGRRAIRRSLPLPRDPAAALVAVRPENGAIKALIGGRDFRRQKFNLASQGRRQPGSSFKPFTLVAALETGISPLRRYDSSSPTVVETDGEPWEVENASGRGYGRIDLRAATQNSVNTVYAQLIMDVGPERVVGTARRMGIESTLPAVPSLALGTAPVAPLEMAGAYTTLANGGHRCPPFAIRTVLDRDGHLLAGADRKCRPALEPGVAARAVDMLRRVVTSGTGTAARLDPWPAFGKTGTTDDFGDAWFVGCTAQLCTSTWVGHVEGRVPMLNVHGTRVFGGTFPARIWRDFMATAMKGKPVADFPEPPPMKPPAEERGRQLRRVPDVTGMRAAPARATLEAAGFEVVIRAVPAKRPREDGVVAGQSPAGGTKARKGSPVLLAVGRIGLDAASPTPSPTPVEGDPGPSPTPHPKPSPGSPPKPSPEPSPSPAPSPSPEPSPPPEPSPSPEPTPTGDPSPSPEPSPTAEGPTPGPSPTGGG